MQNVAGLTVDMMLAVNRLKRATAQRWGWGAPYDLRMAVVGTDECGDVTEAAAGDTATVTVRSNDPQAMESERVYPLVRRGERWLLTVDREGGRVPDHATTRDVRLAARHLIDLIGRVGDEVRAGKCADIDDVQRHISEGMGAP